MPSQLTEPESSVEVLQWGDSTKVIHGEGEGEWLTVENEDYFFDTEEMV